MNVREINNSTNETLAHYVWVAVGFTLFVSWLVVALQKDSSFHQRNSGVLRRTLWPLFYAHALISTVTEIRGWIVRAGRRSPLDIRPSSA
jgi:hypothetical protein